MQKWFETGYNVTIVYRNLKSENSQDYSQKPQLNCTFMNSASRQELRWRLMHSVDWRTTAWWLTDTNKTILCCQLTDWLLTSLSPASQLLYLIAGWLAVVDRTARMPAVRTAWLRQAGLLGCRQSGLLGCGRQDCSDAGSQDCLAAAGRTTRMPAVRTAWLRQAGLLGCRLLGLLNSGRQNC